MRRPQPRRRCRTRRLAPEKGLARVTVSATSRRIHRDDAMASERSRDRTGAPIERTIWHWRRRGGGMHEIPRGAPSGRDRECSLNACPASSEIDHEPSFQRRRATSPPASAAAPRSCLPRSRHVPGSTSAQRPEVVDAPLLRRTRAPLHRRPPLASVPTTSPTSRRPATRRDPGGKRGRWSCRPSGRARLGFRRVGPAMAPLSSSADGLTRRPSRVVTSWRRTAKLEAEPDRTSRSGPRPRKVENATRPIRYTPRSIPAFRAGGGNGGDERTTPWHPTVQLREHWVMRSFAS